MSNDIENTRAQFPILQRMVHNKPLVYFDNAATTQKPLAVINAMQDCYNNYYSAIHRSVHTLSYEITTAYENTREKVCAFINAKHREEIIFVRGTTEGINLVAASFGKLKVQAQDEILISTMEHHSNIIPWQMLCETTGAKLKIIPISDTGVIDMVAYANLLNDRTRIVAITHASNVLGTINPVKQMISLAHARNIPVLVDGAQAVPHLPVDVQDLDCDFYVFSGHKMYTPTGIGVLYGKKSWLEQMPPYQTGGGTISSVTFEKTTFAPIPNKFEAGTPSVVDTIGLSAAIDYLQSLGMQNIAAHGTELLQYATAKLQQIPGLRIIGTAPEKVPLISFVLDDAHPHDIGTILDTDGIAIRAGHHCAMPLMERFNIAAAARVSFSVYNTKAEVDLLVQSLAKVMQVFAK